MNNQRLPDIDVAINNNINLQEDFIYINDNIKIPNFYKNKFNNIIEDSYWEFEFLNSINKLFFYKEDYQYNGLTCYETDQFFIKPDDIVFDCGANMGLFSAAAAAKCKQVYSFEPMSLIRKNLLFTAQQYNNITVIPCGVWHKDDIIKMIQKDNPSASVSEERDIFFGNKNLYYEKCSVISLDNFIKKTNIKPNFIKVDIENSEINMLQGLQEYLKEYSPIISIALHDKFDFNTILRLFPKNYNFKLEQINNRNVILIGGTNDY